jgi:hypothetical protein
MAGRETVMTPSPQHRQRVRVFALAWTGLTLFIGAIAFLGIYAATGLLTVNAAPRVSPVAITANDNANNTDSSNPNASNTANGNNANDSAPAALPANTTNSVAVVAQDATATQGVPPTNTPRSAAPANNVAATSPATQAPTGNTGNPTPTLSAVADSTFDLGIAVQDNPDPNVFKIWADQASKDLKLNWVKLQLVWRDVEKDKGNIYFGALDTELPLLQAAHVKVLLSVTKAPAWARDKGAKNVADQYDGPPSDPKEFATFITTVLKKYPGMIHAVEVWNEVNLDREWSTAPQKLDPARYVTLLQTAHDAIKAVDPNILVISAALSPTGSSQGDAYQDDFVYFKKLVDAGMLKYADCVGAHHNGYNVPPDQDATNVVNRPKAIFRGPFDNNRVHSWYFKATIEGYHKMIAAANSTVQICVTEFGWPSLEGLKGQPRPGFEFAQDNSLADQATYIDGAIKEMQGWGWVRLAFLFNLNYGYQAGFNMQGPSSDNIVYSILGPNFVPRPVWQKIQAYDFHDQARTASTPK